MVSIKEHWEFYSSEKILGIEIGDVNNNGQKEIIGFTKSGKLYIFSLNGKKLTELEISENSSLWQAMILDNTNEIITAGLDGLLRTYKCITSYELNPFWIHQFGASISGFLFDDVNNDGNKEIIAYSIDKSMRCLNPIDGSLIWGQLFGDGIGEAIIWQDTKNPSLKEIIACGNDGTIRVFKGENGELLWFKHFNEKIRCVSYMKSNRKELIVCGGDDKKLHVIDKSSQEELKTIEFDDFVWRCSSFNLEKKSYLLVSSYSFAFFDDSIEIKDIEFSSKLMCLNSELENIWEITNVNVETLIHIDTFSMTYVIIGTTKGNILIVNAGSGKIIAEINKNSCVNDIKYDSELNILISCHDNGSIFAYFLGKS